MPNSVTLSQTITRMNARLISRIRSAVERSPSGGPMVMAAFVGLLTGLGAAGFEALIDLVHAIIFDWLLDDVLGAWGDWKIVIAPALGGSVVAAFTYLVARDARGPGVAPVLASVETAGGRMNPWVVITKPIASSLTIGSGGSAGKEGPVVQLGSALGSAVGQTLRLSEENVKLMLASGAAGGIAATFNAPIAGVFFALEVILRRFNTRNFSVVVLAAVIATTTAVLIRGEDPVASLAQEYRLVTPAIEIPLYALLGALGGVVGVVFIVTLYWTEDRFQTSRLHPLAMPALGGLLVGLLALGDEDVLGLGEEALAAALSGDAAIRTLLVLLSLKLIATSLTIGSGGSGGVFGPSLIIGATLGGAFGGIVEQLLPGQTGTSGAFALVGMAALTAGTARSPITAVLIIFELTRDYALILPLMTAVVTATVVSQLLSRDTIYTYRLSRRGVLIEEEQVPVNVMQTLRVADAMTPVAVRLAASAPVEEIAMQLSEDRESIALVVSEEGELEGVITDTDVTRALSEGEEGLTAADVCTTNVQTIFPDQSLHEALGVFAGRSMHALPVMLRAQPAIPCGILRRADITNAYARAIESRDTRVRRGRLRPVLSDDVRYLELRVERGSVLSGHRLSEVQLPENAIMVAVRHDGATIIPRGHTRLITGDRVTVIAGASAVDEVQAMFRPVVDGDNAGTRWQLHSDR